jgi:hypothetical protein
MMPFLIWRLLDEERLLARDLAGYTDYQSRVRYPSCSPHLATICSGQRLLIQREQTAPRLFGLRFVVDL